jgi:WD40 repeat protein
MLAAVGQEGIVIIYDLATGQQLYGFNSPSGGLLSVTWSPDSRRVAAGGWSKFIYVWCVDQQSLTQCSPGKLLTSIEAHDPYVLDVAWSPDGTRIASVNQQDQAVKIWDANTYQLINGFYQGDPFKVEWSPDSQTLAVVDYLGGLVLIDASLEESTQHLIGPDNIPVYSVAWSPDGQKLAIGTGSPLATVDSSGVYIWDVNQDIEIANLQGHEQVVYTVSWNPNGDRIASYDEDRSVRVWDVATEQLIEVIPLDEDTSMSGNSFAWSVSGETVIFGGGKMHLPIGLTHSSSELNAAIN